MNTRSPYPDVAITDVSLPGFVPDRADERGAAVPLMGPADHGSASPLMGPATAGTTAPLLGPADRGPMVPHGFRRPGYGHAADAPKPVMPHAEAPPT
jgi:hypothetical protein